MIHLDKIDKGDLATTNRKTTTKNQHIDSETVAISAKSILSAPLGLTYSTIPKAPSLINPHPKAGLESDMLGTSGNLGIFVFLLTTYVSLIWGEKTSRLPPQHKKGKIICDHWNIFRNLSYTCYDATKTSMPKSLNGFDFFIHRELWLLISTLLEAENWRLQWWGLRWRDFDSNSWVVVAVALFFFGPAGPHSKSHHLPKLQWLRLCRNFQDEDEDKPIIGPKLDSRGRMQLGNLDLRAWLQ